MTLVDYRSAKPKLVKRQTYKIQKWYPLPRKLYGCYYKMMAWLVNQDIDWENTIVTMSRPQYYKARFDQFLNQALVKSQLLTALYRSGAHNTEIYEISNSSTKTLIGGRNFAHNDEIFRFVKRRIKTEIKHPNYLKCLAHGLVGYHYGVNYRSYAGINRINRKSKKVLPDPTKFNDIPVRKVRQKVFITKESGK